MVICASSGEKGLWDNRQSTAVGKGDSKADEQIADYEVKDTTQQSNRKHIDPKFVRIQHFSEDKADHKAEKIFRDKSFL